MAAPVRTSIRHGARVVGAVAAAILLASASATAGAGGAGASTPARAAAASAPTPLLSVRRVPGWVAANLAAQREAATLRGIVTRKALGQGNACMMVTQDGHVIASSDAATPLIPASNLKVLTATAALDKLGPAYRYTTQVRAARPPKGGVVEGNLYLVGSGDPVLRTPQYELILRDTVPVYTSLAALASQVRAAGVTEVSGTVVGDESRYDTQRSIPTWESVYTSEGDVGPLSALDVDDGFAQAAPGGSYIAATDPPQAAAQTFMTLLAAAGVKVVGKTAAAGTTPPGAVGVTSIQSPPMSEILRAMLVPSDDTAAEEITKELGKAVAGSGTTAAGTEVIEADLAAHGYPVAGLVMADGSGLDRLDRVTCGLLAAVLARAGATSTLAADLPVAGRTGTLTSTRMRGTAAAGRVLAKTGTLVDVSALSGFVLPAKGAVAPTLQLATPVVFSLVMDGVSDSTGVDLGNRVAIALAGYPPAIELSSLGPGS